MKIWLPYIKTNSGGDVAIDALASDFESIGHQVLLQPLPHLLQYAPWLLRIIPCPPDIDLIISTDWWGFACKRRSVPLIVIIHGFLCDPIYREVRSFGQAVFHETIIRYCYQKTQKSADRLVTVSEYTSSAIQRALGGERCAFIYNGIDVEFYCPDESAAADHSGRKKRILFVGNLLRRKGATLLPEIMSRLGPDYELRYTTGWRSNVRLPAQDNFTDLGLLGKEQLREEYRAADVLLFPTRLESFALPVAEAMACGTPVVTSDCAALPELVINNVTGRLCTPGSVEEYAKAIQDICADPDTVGNMGQRSRERAVKYFDRRQSRARYVALAEDTLNMELQ